MKYHIVVTDAYTTNPGDLSFTDLENTGEVVIYDYTTTDELLQRVRTADIIVSNKTILDRKTIEQLPNLKCICISATGYNNVDIHAARERNIPVCNVSGYSTHSVAQYVFAAMSALQNKIVAHSDSAKSGKWADNRDFSYTLSSIHEFYGKTMGIYGFGRIGQQVATIAQAYGMRVISTHKHPERDAGKGATFVDWDTLLQESDYLSLHAPLTEENKGIINAENLQKMKSSAILINTGRGGFIKEEDLKTALESGQIAAAALDVLATEPPADEHPLMQVNNCLITPHIAWASIESRTRLLQETVKNIRAFQAGQARNVVN